MVSLLLAELSYNKQHLLVLLGLVILFTAYNLYRPDASPNILMLFLTFVTVNNMNIFRNKEKRDRYSALLPISMTQIGLMRVILLIIPFIGVLLYWLFPTLLYSDRAFNSGVLITFSGVIITVYCIVYILKDLVSYAFRKIGLTKKRALIVLFIVVFTLNFFTFFAFFESTRFLFVPLEKVFIAVESLIDNSPINSMTNVYYYLIFLLVMMSTTVITINFRKSFLD
ncbi:MAG: hypothetical protein GY863_08315 [bacterium]|nr:hypothetical protein [bacterium]